MKFPGRNRGNHGLQVTTFAVVWIEIVEMPCPVFVLFVTTFAVVWIEIRQARDQPVSPIRHHLRGGVD